MTVQTSTNLQIRQFLMDGNPQAEFPCTIAQDAARVTALAQWSWMHRVPATGKWVPFNDLEPSFANMVCGAYGANLAATQAVGDGEFAMVINGVTVDITGLVFTSITALSDIPGVINPELAPYGVQCSWDDNAGVVTFYALEPGAGFSISVLAAVSGGSGTDISGAGFLNGLTGTGTLTAGDSQTPDGIYTGTGITAAEIAAGDVTLQPIWTVPNGAHINASAMVFDGGVIDQDSILIDHSMTVGQYIRNLGWIPVSTYADSAYEN